MNPYELTFLTENALPVEELEKALKAAGGKKISEKSWGKRLLAYNIGKATSAEYHTWIISLPKTGILELQKKLNYEKLVMRYLLLQSEVLPVKKLKTEKKPETPEVKD